MKVVSREQAALTIQAGLKGMLARQSLRGEIRRSSAAAAEAEEETEEQQEEEYEDDTEDDQGVAGDKL